MWELWKISIVKTVWGAWIYEILLLVGGLGKDGKKEIAWGHKEKVAAKREFNGWNSLKKGSELDQYTILAPVQ